MTAGAPGRERWILVLGGTGRTGRWLVSEALARGYTVHAVARDPAQLGTSHERLIVFRGTPENATLLSAAMAGPSAVLSALNVSRRSDFPWAPLRAPEKFVSETTARILRLAPEHGIRRVIVLSAHGTHETKARIPFWFRWLIDHSNIGLPYRDHERAETLLPASELDWTVLRPVGLTNSTRERAVKLSIDPGERHALTVSRRSVARAMLDVLEQHTFVRERPTISNA